LSSVSTSMNGSVRPIVERICATRIDIRSIDEIHTGVRCLVEDPN
jgi:hypothetical protein